VSVTVISRLSRPLNKWRFRYWLCLVIFIYATGLCSAQDLYSR